MQNERIAELNDLLRKTFIGGRIVITAGIAALAGPDQAAILAKNQHSRMLQARCEQDLADLGVDVEDSVLSPGR